MRAVQTGTGKGQPVSLWTSVLSETNYKQHQVRTSSFQLGASDAQKEKSFLHV